MAWRTSRRGAAWHAGTGAGALCAVTIMIILPAVFALPSTGMHLPAGGSICGHLTAAPEASRENKSERGET